MFTPQVYYQNTTEEVEKWEGIYIHSAILTWPPPCTPCLKGQDRREKEAFFLP